MADRLLLAALAAVCLGTAVGFMGRTWWLFDVFSHFRVQYALLAAVLGVSMAAGQRLPLVAVSAACVAINLIMMLPYYAVQPQAASGSTGDFLRATTMNVYYKNRRYDLAERFVRDTRPDFLVAVEMTPAWQQGLARIEDLYPHVIARPRRDTFGLALYSRHRCDRCAVLDLGNVGIPSIVAEFTVLGTSLRVVGVHFTVPVVARDASLMRRHIDGVADYLAGLTGPTLLLGDFNATPWSTHFRYLLTRTGLRDSGLGFGVRSTWPAWMPFPGVAIDHCLVSPGIRVVDRRVGPSIGSDHRPVTVDLVVDPTRQSRR